MKKEYKDKWKHISVCWFVFVFSLILIVAVIDSVRTNSFCYWYCYADSTYKDVEVYALNLQDYEHSLLFSKDSAEIRKHKQEISRVVNKYCDYYEHHEEGQELYTYIDSSRINRIPHNLRVKCTDTKSEDDRIVEIFVWPPLFNGSGYCFVYRDFLHKKSIGEER